MMAHNLHLVVYPSEPLGCTKPRKKQNLFDVITQEVVLLHSHFTRVREEEKEHIMAALVQSIAFTAVRPTKAAAARVTNAAPAKMHFAGKAVKGVSARMTTARRGQRLMVRADGEEAADAPAADAASSAASTGDDDDDDDDDEDDSPVRSRGT